MGLIPLPYINNSSSMYYFRAIKVKSTKNHLIAIKMLTLLRAQVKWAASFVPFIIIIIYSARVFFCWQSIMVRLWRNCKSDQDHFVIAYFYRKWLNVTCLTAHVLYVFEMVLNLKHRQSPGEGMSHLSPLGTKRGQHIGSQQALLLLHYIIYNKLGRFYLPVMTVTFDKSSNPMETWGIQSSHFILCQRIHKVNLLEVETDSKTASLLCWKSNVHHCTLSLLLLTH